jgi:hypothetical protein
MHSGSGCQTVIYEDHGATTNVWRRPAASVKALVRCQLRLLSCSNRIDQKLRKPEALCDLIVVNTHATSGDRAHFQFLVSRSTELAHDEDIQACTERASNFVPDQYTPSR